MKMTLIICLLTFVWLVPVHSFLGIPNFNGNTGNSATTATVTGPKAVIHPNQKLKLFVGDVVRVFCEVTDGTTVDGIRFKASKTNHMGYVEFNATSLNSTHAYTDFMGTTAMRGTTTLLCLRDEDELAISSIFILENLPKVTNETGILHFPNVKSGRKFVLSWSLGDFVSMEQNFFIRVSAAWSSMSSNHSWENCSEKPQDIQRSCSATFNFAPQLFFIIKVHVTTNWWKSYRRHESFFQTTQMKEFPEYTKEFIPTDYVKSGPPLNLKIEGATSRCFNISWSKPLFFEIYSEDMQVLISATDLDSKASNQIFIMTMKSSSNVIMNTQVCDLSPDTSYELSMKVKEQGKGYWSDASNTDAGKTAEDIPSVGPPVTNTSFWTGNCNENKRTVIIYWTDLKKSETNGKLAFFDIYFNSESMRVRGGSNHARTELSCDEDYIVKLYSLTAVGKNTNPSTMIIPKKESLLHPEFPLNLKVEKLDSSGPRMVDLNVTWDMADADSNLELNLAFYFCGSESFSLRVCLDDFIYQTVPLSQGYLEISNVSSSADMFGYALDGGARISGINWTECVFDRNEDPPVVKNVNAFPGDSEGSILVMWKSQECSRSTLALVLYYQVRYCTQQQLAENSKCQEVKVLGGDSSSIHIEGLVPGEEYIVTVSAGTAREVGLPSLPISSKPADRSSGFDEKQRNIAIIFSIIFVLVLGAIGFFILKWVCKWRRKKFEDRYIKCDPVSVKKGSDDDQRNSDSGVATEPTNSASMRTSIEREEAVINVNQNNDTNHQASDSMANQSVFDSFATQSNSTSQVVHRKSKLVLPVPVPEDNPFHADNMRGQVNLTFLSSPDSNESVRLSGQAVSFVNRNDPPTGEDSGKDPVDKKLPEYCPDDALHERKVDGSVDSGLVLNAKESGYLPHPHGQDSMVPEGTARDGGRVSPVSDKNATSIRSNGESLPITNTRSHSDTSVSTSADLNSYSKVAPISESDNYELSPEVLQSGDYVTNPFSFEDNTQVTDPPNIPYQFDLCGKPAEPALNHVKGDFPIIPSQDTETKTTPDAKANSFVTTANESETADPSLCSDYVQHPLTIANSCNSSEPTNLYDTRTTSPIDSLNSIQNSYSRVVGIPNSNDQTSLVLDKNHKTETSLSDDHTGGSSDSTCSNQGPKVRNESNLCQISGDDRKSLRFSDGSSGQSANENGSIASLVIENDSSSSGGSHCLSDSDKGCRESVSSTDSAGSIQTLSVANDSSSTGASSFSSDPERHSSQFSGGRSSLSSHSTGSCYDLTVTNDSNSCSSGSRGSSSSSGSSLVSTVTDHDPYITVANVSGSSNCSSGSSGECESKLVQHSINPNGEGFHNLVEDSHPANSNSTSGLETNTEGHSVLKSIKPSPNKSNPPPVNTASSMKPISLSNPPSSTTPCPTNVLLLDGIFLSPPVLTTDSVVYSDEDDEHNGVTEIEEQGCHFETDGYNTITLAMPNTDSTTPQCNRTISEDEGVHSLPNSPQLLVEASTKPFQS